LGRAVRSSDFLTRNADVQLEVLCTDRPVHLVEESFDIAIHAGNLADSTLVARNLGEFQFVMVASPRYLKHRGRPRTPEELTEHRCLLFNVGSAPRVWRLAQGEREREIAIDPVLSVNDLDILHNAAPPAEPNLENDPKLAPRYGSTSALAS
jgi:DNA-binding transcriptional LysR family regulator